MNKPDLLIQLEVSSSERSRNCEFATGYPVGHDRIITAAHVLKSRIKSPFIEKDGTDPLIGLFGPPGMMLGP